jgi:hypothetical protein
MAEITLVSANAVPTEPTMSSRDDDLDSAESDAAMDEINRHGVALHQLIRHYTDEHDLLEEVVSVILLDLSVRMRMVGYALETEKPSASGLKLDLDRFRGEVDSCIRAAKKDADRFIAEAKRARAAAENETDGEEDDKGGVPS